ncbi:MAG: hypothetical protein JW894_13370 [Bacteroidales bacterium]|nr:hypothetical protein [Bacteroidales bacterium]
MKNIFSKDGRLIIPITDRKASVIKNEDKVRYIVDKAFCPKGCNLIDPEYLINGFPGLRLKFSRSGMEGEFIISAIEGDFDKIILSGQLKDGVKDDLFCPHCDTMLSKLANCSCQKGAEMVVIGLTPVLDFNDAIAFCNVTGCSNGAFIKSGDVIRHIRLQGEYSRY